MSLLRGACRIPELDMPELKAGPLTKADLLDAWKGATDVGYSEPLVAAGDGNGMEAWGQFFAQLERASIAVDVTTQSLFISPWSGQTSEPASGPSKSTVALTLSRTMRLGDPLLVVKGTVVSEVSTDWGENGAIEFESGRRFLTTQDAFFPIGFTGPVVVQADAELPGHGFDNPLPGSLQRLPQPGDGFNNDLASVTYNQFLTPNRDTKNKTTIIAENEADMFVPDHIGQYVLLETGLNAGRVALVVDFIAPAADGSAGSGVYVETYGSRRALAVTGMFFPGEVVAFRNITNTGVDGYGTFIAGRTIGSVFWFLTNLTSGTTGYNVVGLSSGAVATYYSGQTVLNTYGGVGGPLLGEAPVGGSGGAGWRVLSWVDDWGLTVTNVQSPTGGRAAMLDELGLERNIPRAPGESDDAYRARVRDVGDVVTPNAIRRALNRSFAGYQWCLREVGYAGLPGFFFDGTDEPPSITPHGAKCDAWDTDVLILQGGAGFPVFGPDEPVVLEDATTFARYARGYVGSDAFSGKVVMIRKDGSLPTSFTNVRLRSLAPNRNGVTYAIASGTRPATAEARRWRTWLDYEQFRAFFVVTLQALNLGEFGFAYDKGPRSAFDSILPAYAGAWDGYPRIAADLYRQVHAAIDQARAGGVGFEFRTDAGSCP